MMSTIRRALVLIMLGVLFIYVSALGYLALTWDGCDPPEFWVTPPTFPNDGRPLTEEQFTELQRWLRAEQAARDAAGDDRPIMPVR